jgi:cellulose 1,4-beta-cellobiosidase
VDQNGEARYQQEFIDPIATEFAARPEQPVVVIYEPDSLANLATNMGLPKCKASRSVYKAATIYALRKFALSNVSVYLDAAHAGWLGWDDNRNKMVKVFKQVLHDAGGLHLIRGFATNLANYGHLTNRDLARIEPTNPCANELDYVRKLSATLEMYGLTGKGFVVDTSRNGRGNLRRKSGYWCNLQGAGLGERPKVDPETNIDAYYWIKTPGESDGVSEPTQPRFDPFCASPDSAKNAPQAGKWFESYFLDLVRNAEPPL